MVNTKMFITALKSTWVRRMITENKKYMNFITSLYDKMNDFPKVGPEYIINNLKHVDNPFWNEVFRAYYECCVRITPLNSIEVNI